LPGKLARASARIPGLSIATVRLADLPKIAANRNVLSISLAQALTNPQPMVSNAAVAAPSPGTRRFGSAAKHANGKGILIGVIDVQGFDFAHPDFLDARGGTRWISIWDQGGQAKPGKKPPFGYGAEISAAEMAAALQAAPTIGAPATELEPQSQMDPGSHGTHVASIAAGNLGVCREAMIAGVLVSLGREDEDRRRSFYDSTRLAHAVDYL